MTKWKIRLKSVHDESGLTAYRVAKDTGMNVNTVYRYVNNEVVAQDILPAHVITLVKYYGRDWHDANIIEFSDEDESQPEPAVA